jgi:hypothetical protein
MFAKLYWRTPLVQVVEWCGWNNNNDYLLLQLFLSEFYVRETLLESTPSPSGRVGCGWNNNNDYLLLQLFFIPVRTLDQTTDISQYRLRFGSSLLYKSVFHLDSLTAQLSYEGRAAVEGGK